MLSNFYKMRYCLVFIFCFLLFSCSKKEKSPTKVSEKKPATEIIQKKSTSKKKTENKEEETISRKNTVEFLTKYGKENPETLVLFKTRLGNIKVKLYRDTPIHRASFIFLAKEGYFNTVCVHRVVEYFVVQGGNSENPKTRAMRKRFDSYRIPSEFRAHRKHKYGALAAARQWKNNPKKVSTPFEFYFVIDENGSHHLDGEHTVYGEVLSGFETLKKIEKLELNKENWPKDDVYFKVEVLR